MRHPAAPSTAGAVMGSLMRPVDMPEGERRIYAGPRPIPAPIAGRSRLKSSRVYASVRQDRDGIGWKEINQAIARIMQDYCGKYKNELTLNTGIAVAPGTEGDGTGHPPMPPIRMNLVDCWSVLL